MCAAKHGAEEAVAVHYILRALGIKVDKRTMLIGDNLGMLQSTTNPTVECKKKHVSVDYNYVRECDAAGITKTCKIDSVHNLSDLFTKALDKVKFWEHFD